MPWFPLVPRVQLSAHSSGTAFYINAKCSCRVGARVELGFSREASWVNEAQLSFILNQVIGTQSFWYILCLPSNKLRLILGHFKQK